MEHILETLETLIDGIMTDDQMDKDEILHIITKIKEELEDHQLSINEGGSFEWDDLD